MVVVDWVLIVSILLCLLLWYVFELEMFNWLFVSDVYGGDLVVVNIFECLVDMFSDLFGYNLCGLRMFESRD